MTESRVPEHNLRGVAHTETDAAYRYVKSVEYTADVTQLSGPMWYSWELREAFLAGISYSEKQRSE